MLQMLQRAMHYINELPFAVQSKLSAELAYAYAKNGQTKKASYHIKNARDILPEEGEEIPVYFAADSGLFQLLLFEGLTGLEMGTHDPKGGHYQWAYNNLERIESLPTTITVPERIRVEVINQRALIAVKTGNMEAFQQHLIAGIQGAKALSSQKRLQEAIANWKEARKVWPHEKQVLELADLLV
jgi:tetratricopeptide (TPR) repeat protein